MAGDDEDHVANNKIEPLAPTKIPYWRLVFDQGVVTQEIVDYDYLGSGTEDDPYAVTWLPDDPRNPMNFSSAMKWSFTMVMAIATLAVALVSSAYTGGVEEIEKQFVIGGEVATLGVSLFVLGFAVNFSSRKMADTRMRMLTCNRSVRCFGLPSVSCSAARSSSSSPTPHSLRSTLVAPLPRTPGP